MRSLTGTRYSSWCVIPPNLLHRQHDLLQQPDAGVQALDADAFVVSVGAAFFVFAEEEGDQWFNTSRRRRARVLFTTITVCGNRVASKPQNWMLARSPTEQPPGTYSQWLATAIQFDSRVSSIRVAP